MYNLTRVRQELKQNADDKTRDSFQHFFRETFKFYGVKVPIVNQIARKYFAEVKNLSKQEIFDLCEELFKSGYCEEAFVACTWSEKVAKQYLQDDFATFERWVDNYVDNWAVCDTLCNHTVGTFLEMYPKYVAELKRWAKSPNRWMKRAAAVSLIVPAKRGLFLHDIFQIALILLVDTDDLVQKGYGWMLKEASKEHQSEVFEFILLHKTQMPRTALRYAIEKMPDELRKQAMAK